MTTPNGMGYWSVRQVVSGGYGRIETCPAFDPTSHKRVAQTIVAHWLASEPNGHFPVENPCVVDVVTEGEVRKRLSVRWTRRAPLFETEEEELA